MSAQPRKNYTEKEYWQLEERSLDKSEYYRGNIFSMAGGSKKHNFVAGNVHNSLRNQLRGKECQPFNSDQRIKSPISGLQTYPDVSVICPPFSTDPNNDENFVDATIIVEVLSPSTMQYDRTGKFEFYKEMPSLRHYILIEPNEINVEHRFLNAQNEWQTESFTLLEDSFRLEVIGCVLKVNEIYEDIEKLGS